MSELSLGSLVRPAQDVLFRKLEGEAILLGLETAAYYGLEPIGTRIWELIGEGGRVSAVLERILAEYEVEEDVARHDLLRLIDDLAARRLVVIEPDPEQ